MIIRTHGRTAWARRARLILASAFFVLFAAFVPASASSDFFQTKNGLTVYLGVLPAAMIQGHSKDHPEMAMHGGVPHGRDAYHVMAAVFDAASGSRIEDAKVEARVSPLGLAGVTRVLEPMQIAGTVTHGNYFTLRANEPYRILISVARNGKAKPVEMEYFHEHRTR